MSFTVEVFPDDEWAELTSERFRGLVANTPKARICLPTGATVEPFYERVAQTTDLSGLTIFLLDEFGGLPLGDPGRCQSMIQRHLLDISPGTPTFHHPDVDAEDIEGESNRYQTQLGGGGLDLAILGLGANGHLGMNEPGSQPDSATRRVDLAKSTTDHAAVYGATVTPTWGVTIGMGPLLAAKQVWLMVTGSHKAEILSRTLSEPIGPDLPATYLSRHDNCVVFVDESAAG